MASIQVDDIRTGMDRRRTRLTGAPGSLWSLCNAHIRRGGGVEQCKAFVKVATLPAGTTGLAPTGRTPFVFGTTESLGAVTYHEAPPTAADEIQYQAMPHPAGYALSSVLAWDRFDGKLYVVAEYADGSVLHWYGGQRVEAWDGVLLNLASNDDVAAALASRLDADGVTVAVAGSVLTLTAQVAGTAFNASASTVHRGAVDDQEIVVETATENVEAAASVPARAQFQIVKGKAGPNHTIESVEADGKDLFGGISVLWTTSHANTATLVAAQINGYTGTHGYSATAIGAIVRITAPAGSGAEMNGSQLEVTLGAGSKISIDGVTAFEGGVNAVAATAQVVTLTVSGTFEPEDQFTVTVDGSTASVSGSTAGVGRTAHTTRSKLYSGVGNILNFSEVNNPRNPRAGIGGGLINLSNQVSGASDIVRTVDYQSYMAIFCRDLVQIWSIDEDENNNRFQHVVRETGTRSPRSVLPYGNLDVYYLDISGIRSLRPRDSSGSAGVDDIGTLIDPFVIEHIRSLSEATIAKASSVIEPLDRRFWLVLGSRVYVFSSFPGARISAWSYYQLPFEPDEVVRIGDRIYLRHGDDVYVYGGYSGDQYPPAGEMDAEIEFPYMTGKSPTAQKKFNGFDAALTGVWSVELIPDPEHEDATVHVGTLARSTYPDGRISTEFDAPGAAVRMVRAGDGYASVESITLHHHSTHEAG